PGPLELPAEPRADSGNDPAGDQEVGDGRDGDTGGADEPKPGRPFDPVAAFLSTQSVSGTPRLSSPEEDAHASAAPEDGEDDLQDDFPHDALYDGEEPEEPEPPAAPHYRRHPLVRAFNFFCWCLLLTFLAGAAAGFFYFR